MIERYLLLYGEKKTLELLTAFTEPPVPSIRINNLISGEQRVIALLEGKGFHLEAIPWCPDGYWIYDSNEFDKTKDLSICTRFNLSPGATHEYLQGIYSLQGASSMLPVELLDPKPGESVLDMAAAPGSKFVQIAQRMKNRGLLVGVDRSMSRIKALKANVFRCGVRNAVIIHQDSRRLEEDFLKYDKILLDAPCTGEGLIGSDPKRKFSRTVDDIRKLMEVQIELLGKAVRLANTPGKIVYSTCSLAPEENEYVVNRIIKENSEVQLSEIPRSIKGYFDDGLTSAFGERFDKSLKRTLRIYPYHHACRPEGFFIAVLEKKI